MRTAPERRFALADGDLGTPATLLNSRSGWLVAQVLYDQSISLPGVPALVAIMTALTAE